MERYLVCWNKTEGFKQNVLSLFRYDFDKNKWEYENVLYDDVDQIVYFKNMFFVINIDKDKNVVITTGKKYQSIMDKIGFKKNIKFKDFIIRIRRLYFSGR